MIRVDYSGYGTEQLVTDAKSRQNIIGEIAVDVKVGVHKLLIIMKVHKKRNI